MKWKSLLTGTAFLLSAWTLTVPAAAASQTLTVNLDTSQADSSSEISPLLYGIFLEDINFTIDGGIYAQQIRNGSFEYGALAKGGAQNGYSVSNKDDLTFLIADGSEDGTCLNENNPHYAVLTNTASTAEGIGNKGYLRGLAVTEGTPYDCSVFLKGLEGYTGPVTLMLDDTDGTVLAQAEIPAITEDWQKYECVLTPDRTAAKGLRLWVKIGTGSTAVDMISFSTQDTYKGRKNGIRRDVGEYLEALHPRFLRFPGGCVVEGTNDMNQYSWKDSIGDGMHFSINGEDTVGAPATRPVSLNIWHRSQTDPYYMTYGIGFYEYFLLCEDLDCLPVPILNAGMTCPIQSGDGYAVADENSEEFQTYIQDALDLAEFCRGGADTTWGAVRIAMGHEAPFPLHYIGIGNEQWQEEYYSHYEKFKEAFADAAQKNPEIYGDLELIIGTGPSSDDRFAWDKIKEKGSDYAGLVDEHYYNLPDWFLANTHRYDTYDRSSVPVFLGEYAAKSNTMEAALAEAAFMTGLEKNADIVKMACYAPLFGNDRSNQWEPDMIFFSNDSLYGTVNYYVQKMFSNALGTQLLDSTLSDEDAGLYQSASLDAEGNLIIKLVNTTGQACDLDISLENGKDIPASAVLTMLAGGSEDAANNSVDGFAVVPAQSTVDTGSSFTLTLPEYSVSTLIF